MGTESGSYGTERWQVDQKRSPLTLVNAAKSVCNFPPVYCVANYLMLGRVKVHISRFHQMLSFLACSIV
jgi:hypothetical protein